MSYYYMDSNSHSDWTLSGSKLDGSDGALVSSFKQVYKLSSGRGALLWNDEVPNGSKSEEVAHSKGALVFDSSSGMFIIHSCPNFPPTSSYSFPDTAEEYGQSFLCMSLESSAVDVVLQYMYIIRAGTYLQKGLSSTLQNKYPHLAAVMNDSYAKESVAKELAITTSGGVHFSLFAKNKAWDQFLYEDLVAPGIGSDLVCETWTKGASSNVVPSFCKNRTTDYSIYNAAHVKFGQDTWDRNDDHSKWAVGVDSAWWCIGGINRQYSQNLRGGGTACSSHYPSLQQVFYASVVDVNPCGSGDVNKDSPPPSAK